ncbi:MAG: hypothetical protein AAFR83_27085, partial [Cyanobacteria bacterium J06629_18]
TAEFSEPVTDFEINDITLTNATASNLVDNFTNNIFFDINDITLRTYATGTLRSPAASILVL